MNRLAVYSYLTQYPMVMPGLAVHRTFARKELLWACCVWQVVLSLSLTGCMTYILWTSPDKGTNGHSQTGPAFQDLTSSWDQPESDNNFISTSSLWNHSNHLLCDFCLSFCPPSHKVRNGGLLNLPSSVYLSIRSLCQQDTLVQAHGHDPCAWEVPSVWPPFQLLHHVPCSEPMGAQLPNGPFKPWGPLMYTTSLYGTRLHCARREAYFFSR